MVTHDMSHVKCDTGHVSRDMWHVTSDIWWGLKFCENFSHLALRVWERQYFEGKYHRATRWINWLMTNVFVEKPRLHWVCSRINEDSSKRNCCHIYQIKAIFKTFLFNIVSHLAFVCFGFGEQCTSSIKY